MNSGQDITPAQIRSFVRSHARAASGGMSILTGIMIAEVLLAVLAPWPMKLIVDEVLGQSPSQWLAGYSRTSLLWIGVAATVLLFLVGAALNVVQSYVSVGVGQRMTYAVATQLFSHLQRLSLRYHARHSVGDAIRRVVTDAGCVTTIVRDCMLPLASSVLTMAVMFLIALRMDWVITLVAVPVIALMWPLVRRYSGPIADRAYEYGETESRSYDVIERTFAAIPVTQTFGRERANTEALRQIYDDTLAAAVRSNAVAMKLRVLAGLLTAIGSAVILYIGATRVVNHELSVGTLLVLLSYMASVYSPLESIVESSRHIADAAGSARRVLEVTSLGSDVKDLPGAAVLQQRPGGAAIQFERVSFAYETGATVLNDISLTIRPGEVVALVGPSGAGKTTLFSMLPRFYDVTSGRILLNGQDIRHVGLKSLRSSVSLVMQQTHLFPVSIADNIAYGRRDASTDEIHAAARAAAADVFIESLPEGYDTVIGERGATLSVGQRQRISIARSLLTRSPLLLLDEPTSSLDADTEAQLVQRLKAYIQNQTIVLIAHRLSTVRMADRVIVLDAGRIIDDGPHAELLARCPLYCTLCEKQLSTEDAHAG